MKLLGTETASISYDMEGDPYFMVGETVYYLNEFMLMPHEGELTGVSHVTNTGGIQIVVDEVNEEVEYTFFTN